MTGDQDSFRISLHEAGHCVTAVACGLSLDRATIDPEIAGPGTAGCVWGTPDCYDCKPLEEFSDVVLHCRPMIDGQPLSRATCVFIYARTIELLAGIEAERLLCDRSHIIAGTSDVQKAMFYSSLFNDPAAFLDHARTDAARILAVNKHQVEAIAAALMEHKTLDRAEIDDIISESMMPVLIRSERARRRRWSATVASAQLSQTLTGGMVRLNEAWVT